MNSTVLQTKLLNTTMKNPVIAASGTFGFGRNYEAHFDPSLLGGISSKGLTLNGSPGNSGTRLHETPSGLMNSIGLENPGVAHFVEYEYQQMRECGAAVIVNLGGHSLEQYTKGAEMLNDIDIDILELNISCPNVKEGGMAFGILPETAAQVTKAVKQISRHPLLVKLSPNAHDIVAVAKACEQAGADGLSLVNTFLGMAIDVNKKQVVFNNTYAGLSGPAIFPIALQMVHRVCKNVSIPVVGLGGIASTEDALAMIMAGAAAIQVGTMTFADPMCMVNIIQGLEEYCIKQNIENISQLRGIV